MVLLVLAGQAVTASAARGGNAGDVWTDNVGKPAGPGHEQDPHLACQDINLWGNGLADGSGTFTIDSWPPSGGGATAYGPAAWSYSRSTGATQVIALIPIANLLAGSKANGDRPQAQQRLHFKLQLVQNPQKHKTFWVECVTPKPTPTPTPTLTPTGTPSPTPTPTPTPTPSGSVSPTATPTGSVNPTSTATASPSPSGSQAGILANTGGGPWKGAGQTLPLLALGILVLGTFLVASGKLLRR